MKSRRQKVPEPEHDPSGWIIDNGVAEFLLLNTHYIKYMAMFGYAFMHGCKLYPKFPEATARAYKFVALILACTGGGTLVPIFINSIPVSLSTDAYAIAILCSFLIHEYSPVVREVLKLSPILKVAVIILYEALRASVVVKLTAAAGKAIAPSDFDMAVFGPIFCGTIGGCGGAFMPLDKGLDPLKDGMTEPMVTAFAAATFYHLFNNTSLSKGIIEASKKSHVIIVVVFIVLNLYESGLLNGLLRALGVPPSKPRPVPPTKGKKTK